MQPVPEFSYSLTLCILFVFVFFLFTIFYSCTKICAYYKEICSPWINFFEAMTYQLKFGLYLPHLKSFELIHFRRRLRTVDCRFYREPEILKHSSHSLMSLHGRSLA